MGVAGFVVFTLLVFAGVFFYADLRNIKEDVATHHRVLDSHDAYFKQIQACMFDPKVTNLFCYAGEP